MKSLNFFISYWLITFYKALTLSSSWVNFVIGLFNYLDIFKILSGHLEAFQDAIFSLPQSKKIVHGTMEIEEEEKGSPTKDLSPHKKHKYLKEVIEKEPSIGLTLGQNGVQHFCENIANIFSIFKAGK